MRKANKNQPGKQKEREKRLSTPPAGKVELTEQDLEQVQGGQNTHPNIKIDF